MLRDRIVPVAFSVQVHNTVPVAQEDQLKRITHTAQCVDNTVNL